MKKIILMSLSVILVLTACFSSSGDSDNNGMADEVEFGVEWYGTRYASDNLYFSIFEGDTIDTHFSNGTEKISKKISNTLLGGSNKITGKIIMPTNDLNPDKFYGFYAFEDKDLNGKYNDGDLILQGAFEPTGYNGDTDSLADIKTAISSYYKNVKGSELGSQFLYSKVVFVSDDYQTEIKNMLNSLEKTTVNYLRIVYTLMEKSGLTNWEDLKSDIDNYYGNDAITFNWTELETNIKNTLKISNLNKSTIENKISVLNNEIEKFDSKVAYFINEVDSTPFNNLATSEQALIIDDTSKLDGNQAIVAIHNIAEAFETENTGSMTDHLMQVILFKQLVEEINISVKKATAVDDSEYNGETGEITIESPTLDDYAKKYIDLFKVTALIDGFIYNTAYFSEADDTFNLTLGLILNDWDFRKSDGTWWAPNASLAENHIDKDLSKDLIGTNLFFMDIGQTQDDGTYYEDALPAGRYKIFYDNDSLTNQIKLTVKAWTNASRLTYKDDDDAQIEIKKSNNSYDFIKNIDYKPVIR